MDDLPIPSALQEKYKNLGGVIIDYPRPELRTTKGEGDNWWVCVFNPEAQYPAVIENVEVTWDISFLGNDFSSLGKTFSWIEAFIFQWIPTFSSRSLSIPPEAQKLWEAFYDEMTYVRKDEKEREDRGLFLGDRATNNFQLVFEEKTNIPY